MAPWAWRRPAFRAGPKPCHHGLCRAYSVPHSSLPAPGRAASDPRVAQLSHAWMAHIHNQQTFTVCLTCSHRLSVLSGVFACLVLRLSRITLKHSSSMSYCRLLIISAKRGAKRQQQRQLLVRSPHLLTLARALRRVLCWFWWAGCRDRNPGVATPCIVPPISNCPNCSCLV